MVRKTDLEPGVLRRIGPVIDIEMCRSILIGDEKILVSIMVKIEWNEASAVA